MDPKIRQDLFLPVKILTSNPLKMLVYLLIGCLYSVTFFASYSFFKNVYGLLLALASAFIIETSLMLISAFNPGISTFKWLMKYALGLTMCAVSCWIAYHSDIAPIVGSSWVSETDQAQIETAKDQVTRLFNHVKYLDSEEKLAKSGGRNKDRNIYKNQKQSAQKQLEEAENTLKSLNANVRDSSATSALISQKESQMMIVLVFRIICCILSWCLIDYLISDKVKPFKTLSNADSNDFEEFERNEPEIQKTFKTLSNADSNGNNGNGNGHDKKYVEKAEKLYNWIYSRGKSHRNQIFASKVCSGQKEYESCLEYLKTSGQLLELFENNQRVYQPVVKSIMVNPQKGHEE